MANDCNYREKVGWRQSRQDWEIENTGRLTVMCTIVNAFLHLVIESVSQVYMIGEAEYLYLKTVSPRRGLV